MSKYQDKWGRFHHKECVNGEPSSNNGWIFTAYAQKLGLLSINDKLGECYNDCRVYNEAVGDYILMRNPGKATSPISRDEILGMVALGVLKHKADVTIGWNFSPYPLPRFNPLKLISQLWQLRPNLFETRTQSVGWKNRNYFWQNNLDQLYRFAFSVPLQDREFMLKKWGKYRLWKPSHLFYSAVALADRLLTRKPNGLDWLKYGNGKGFKNMLELDGIPADHPFRGGE